MDMSQVLNQCMEILLPALATFLVGVFTYLGAKFKAKYEERVNNETAKAVVNDAVRFVEQVYKDLKGPEKLEKATEQVAEILNSKGIKITSAEINMLIESAVYGLNEGWFSEPVIEDTTVVTNELSEAPVEQEIVNEETTDINVKNCEGTE